MIRLVLRSREPRWLAPLLICCAIAITYLLTAGPIRWAGANPMAAYRRYVIWPLTSGDSLGEVLLTSTPLLFTGLAVAIAFRAGFYNIGAEGQFLAGAIAATWAGTTFDGLPAPVAIPFALAAGAVAGALWILVPALLRVGFRIDEVVTTLLLNPVALLCVQGLLNGPWRNPVNQFPESAYIGSGYNFPKIIPGTRVHLGFAVALGLAALAWLVLARTATGLRLRAVGLTSAGARFNGVSVERTMLSSALVSGAIAGMGGVSQVCGLQGQLTGEISAGFGYTGIVVATLAALTPIGVVLVALLLGDIVVGADSASLVLQLPPQMGQVVTATLLLVTVGILVLRRYRPVLSRRRKAAATMARVASREEVLR
ncbi:MAG TPA: ABC transporter permease [Jatrophihabitans sp.]|jgi:simple sugar transport system permease protein|nr:ABC transporter permease [Jatrophihabitans sp.]